MFLLSSLSCLVVRYVCPISREYSSSSGVSNWTYLQKLFGDQALIARLRLDELERHRIHAIAQMSGCGSIVKYVSEMRVTSVAEDLDPPHSVAIVDLSPDASFGYRRPEAWPSRARVEFCLRAEEVVPAGDALVDSGVVQVPVLSCVSSFCSLLSCYEELLRG